MYCIYYKAISEIMAINDRNHPQGLVYGEQSAVDTLSVRDNFWSIALSKQVSSSAKKCSYFNHAVHSDVSQTRKYTLINNLTQHIKQDGWVGWTLASSSRCPRIKPPIVNGVIYVVVLVFLLQACQLHSIQCDDNETTALSSISHDQNGGKITTKESTRDICIRHKSKFS